MITKIKDFFNNNIKASSDIKVESLSCGGNNLPYNNLKEYKEWYAETYPDRVEGEKYNL